MKLQQLAYFVETYKYQNMSIASRKLLVSQPSISAAIRELEQEFDTPLFHRQGKRLLPTKEGRCEIEEALTADAGKQKFLLHFCSPSFVSSFSTPSG